jgi:hypothetical protein
MRRSNHSNGTPRLPPNTIEDFWNPDADDGDGRIFLRVPSPGSFARREAQVRAENNGELPPGWAAAQARAEIMRQPLPAQFRMGMTYEEREAVRNENTRANGCYLAGDYFFHPDYPDNRIVRNTAAAWQESEGDSRPLPHLHGPAESTVHFGFLCQCDNPTSHERGARGQRQRSWIKHCHEKLDHAGKDCITYLEYLEITREFYRRDWPGTYERFKMYDDLIEEVRTGRRQRMRPGRGGSFVWMSEEGIQGATDTRISSVSTVCIMLSICQIV